MGYERHWANGHSDSDIAQLTGLDCEQITAYRIRPKSLIDSNDVNRISQAVASTPNNPIISRNLLSYPQLALTIRELYTIDEVHCTRLIAQTVQQLREVVTSSDLAAYHIMPPATGDSRWDALIAGVAAHTWSLATGGEVLEWVKRVPPLDQLWEPGNMPARWRTWNMLRTPASIIAKTISYPTEWLQAI